MNATRKNKNRNGSNKKKFLIVIPIAVILIILSSFIFISSQPKPFFQFAKVSDNDYAPNNSTVVYFISWNGCPLGATDSWGLYIALSNYGVLNVTPNYSDVEELPLSQNQTIVGNVPGLIFNSFKPDSNIIFKPIYILNRIYNNGTASLPNGTIIQNNNILNVELKELQNEVPDAIYNLIVKYELDTPFMNGVSIAYLNNPNHIPSTIIITGKNGTWMLIGYDQQVDYGTPGVLSLIGRENANSSYLLLKMINQHSLPSGLGFITDEGNQINSIILMASH